MNHPSEIQSEFFQLLLKNQDDLWRYVYSMMRNRHDAEDIMSETILQAHNGYHTLKHQQAFLSFLFTIARRLIKRQQWKRRLFGNYNETEAHAIPSSSPMPDMSTDIRIVHDAMQSLPIKMREALILFEINGLSLEEIKHIQGDSLSAVKSRLMRGRSKLAELLKDSPEAESSLNGIYEQTAHTMVKS